MKRWRHRLLGERLVALGALGLFVSLFVTWSHQLPPARLAEPGARFAFQGVPRDPTAWQVYSIADVLLALLAVALVATVLGRAARPRIGALLAVALALAFTAHALAVPPTNGALLLNTRSAAPSYLPSVATAGPGVTAAIVSLAVAAAGLFTALLSSD